MAGTRDVFRAIETRDRKLVEQLLMKDDIRLGMSCPNTGRSLLFCLLKSVTNGDRLAIGKLDSCVQTTNEDPNSEDHAVVIDHTVLIDDDYRSLSVIKDLMELPQRNYAPVLHHPTLFTFIEAEWKKTKWTFMISLLLYLAYLALFSTFLWMMYWRHSSSQVDRIPVKFSKSLGGQPLGVVEEDGQQVLKLLFGKNAPSSESPGVVFPGK